MQYRHFLIKYAEIGIKGKNRYIFEDALVHQIKYRLKKIDGEFAVNKQQGRVYVHAKSEYDYNELIDALTHIFGIVGICPMLQIENKHNYEEIKDTVLMYLKEIYGDDKYTFKVKARRADKGFPMNSNDINADLGGDILDHFPNTSVDVHNPDVVVYVEIRKEVNIYSKIIPGAGGMPVGTAGKAMLLLSGGIDSPVAGYMIGKRGVVIEACYFHAPPYTGERSKQKVITLAQKMAKYTGPIALHIVNFTEIQLAIYEKCPHEELTIIMRRYMMKIAESIALNRGCLGLITGEAIGQVASQTMESLNATNEVCTLPVYRPVIGFDKQEIIHVAEKINTYETSILPFEDCCTIFVAKHPVTKPNAKYIRKSETHLQPEIDEMFNKAVEEAETVWCS